MRTVQNAATCRPGTMASAVDAIIMCRCIIASYREFTTGKLIMGTIKDELVSSAKSPLGAMRFLREWVTLRYSEDFRRDKSMRRQLFKIALMRPPIQDVSEELGRIKLLLISTGARRLNLCAVSRGQDKPAARVVRESSGRDSRRVDGTTDQTGSALAAEAQTSDSSLASFSSPRTRVLSVAGFMKQDSRRIAQCLFYLGFEALCQVKLTDVRCNGPTAVAHAARFNRLTDWVASMILVQKTVKSMRQVIVKLLEVAQISYELGDLLSCFVIMSSFEMAEVDRLRRLWHLPPNVKAMAANCYAIINPKENYRAYRAMLDDKLDNRKPCTMHIGISQRDLVMGGEGNKCFDQNGNINKEKLIVEGQILALIARCQALPPPGYQKFLEKRNTDPLFRLLVELPSKTKAEREILSAAHRPYANKGDVDEPDSRNEDSSGSGPWTTSSQPDASSSQTSSKSDDSSNQSDEFVDL